MLALVFLSSISTIVGFLQSELLLLNDLVHTNIDYDFCQNQEPRNVGHNNERYANGREVVEGCEEELGGWLGGGGVKDGELQRNVINYPIQL